MIWRSHLVTCTDLTCLPEEQETKIVDEKVPSKENEIHEEMKQIDF